MISPLIRYSLLTLASTFLASTSSGQVTFWNDQFNGGVVTGGVSLGTASGGTASFNTPIPAGSTIHWAYIFGTQVGTATADVNLTLNGTPYQFNASNIVGPIYQSIYGGDAMVHGIDVTNDLDAAVQSYTLIVTDQLNAVTNVYTDFYLYIAYANPNMTSVSALLYFSDMDSQQTLPYTLNSPYPILSSFPVAMATVGGFACSGDGSSDCENITVNGTLLGGFGGQDYNAIQPCGTMGTFSYANGVLEGLGDDNADQAINGADVTSDVAAIVPDGSTSVNVTYDHCPGGTPNDNHLWIIMLAFTSDPCAGTLDLGDDVELCTGDSLVLNATRPNSTYLWQDGFTGPIYTVTTSGQYYVHVESDDCAFDDTINVAFNASPVFDLGNDTTLCLGSSLMLDATSVPPADNYDWSIDTISGPVFTINGGGTIWVTASIGGCSVTDTIVIGLQNVPEVDLGPDQAFCEGGSTTLSVNPGNGTVLWSTGSTASSITVSSTAEVWATVTQNECPGSDTVMITVNAIPDVELGPNLLLCEGESVTLNVSTPGGSYVWEDGSTAATHVFSEAVDTWVTVTVNGCVNSDSLHIAIEECELEIEMPNVFSPNGDASNYAFMPLVIKGVESLTITVWNRWGQAVYTSSDVGFAWNGRISGGTEVPEGTYFWILNYTAIKSHAQGELHGAVTLLR